MAINKNHEFEELDGVKCGIVERMVTAERLAFLKQLLEINGFEVKAVPSPPSKGEEAAAPPGPETYTVGVTDYSFNPVNAIFGRLLRTRDGHVVTLAYWKQEDAISQDDRPYFD